MIEDSDDKERHVIPNWRSFENTAKLGELNGSKNLVFNSTFKPDISDLLEDWRNEENIGIAADVIGAALVCNQEDNLEVREIAQFVLKNKGQATSALIEAAFAILKPRSDYIELTFDINSAEKITEQSSLANIYRTINRLKKCLIVNPYNVIEWIELARYYSILGQDKKAHRSISNALFLNPENRFVLRSCARFFVHVGDFERAHDIVRKSVISKFDPWIMATEIALATLRGRNSTLTKSGIQVVNSQKFHPFNITELASSIGTIELSNAKRSNGKKLIELSLKNPNDNSLAQAQWLNNGEKIISNIAIERIKLAHSFEASAIKYSEQKKWQESIEYSKKWFMDLPFSKRAIVFGNDIALRKLKDHTQAIQIAKMGLVSHPNDAHLLNNIIYSLCLINKLDEAERYFDEVPKHEFGIRNTTGICLMATRGLFYFRSGQPELGRKFYLEALRASKEINDTYLNSNALINYLREEILCGQENVADAIPNLQKIIDYYGSDSTISEEAAYVLRMFLSR